MVFDDMLCDIEKGRWRARRLVTEPIIHSGLDPSIGENIQGPSLICVPDWIENPLGRYYLYFADHKGRFIRLAYSDDLEGPWQIHESGALQLETSCFPTNEIEKPSDYQEVKTDNLSKLQHSIEYEKSTPHIASPDVHVDTDTQTIYMYFHGLESYGVQKTRLAVSQDGVNFSAEPNILCSTYLRVAPYKDRFIGVVMPGIVYELDDRRGPFEDGFRVFPTTARHHALLINRDQVFIFWSEVGEAPEHVKVSLLTADDGDKTYSISHLGLVLHPEKEWEGALARNEPSVRSVAYGRVNQLRDPCIFVEDGRVFLLYAGGGESAIGIAELTWEESV